MNILLINHYAGSPQYGMEFRPFYLAREWVKMGHKVMIVASTQSHLRSKNPMAGREQIEGITYQWFSTPKYRGNGIGRVLNMVIFVGHLLFSATKLAQECRPDIVIASSTYPLDIYPAKYISSLVKAKLIFEVHDLWPLSPMELGNMSKWHPFIVLMQKAENDAYKYADYVVSMLPKAKEHMVAHGMLTEKFNYIPNGVVVDDWQGGNLFTKELPIDYLTCLRQFKKKYKFLVGYTGSHGVANNLKTLVEAAAQLQYSDIGFVFVGDGPEKQALVDVAKNKGLENCCWLESVEKKCIPKLLTWFDICYIGAQKQPLYRFGISPNKLMDYMMASKPIISTIEAGNDLVKESQCGFSLPAEDVMALVEGFKRMRALSLEQREQMGIRGHEYVMKYHSYENLAKRFLNFI